jgi:hypothetical protein
VVEKRGCQVLGQFGFVHGLRHEPAAVLVVQAKGLLREPGRWLESVLPEGPAASLLPVAFAVHQGAVAVEDDRFE